MNLIILDTDAASAVLRNRTSERFRAVKAGQTICITFVTLGELTKWTLLRSWRPQRPLLARKWHADGTASRLWLNRPRAR